MLVTAHEVLFDVEAFGGKIANVAPIAIGDGADGVGRAFGVVVVHAEGVFAMIGVLAIKDGGEAGAVEFFGCWFGTGEVNEGGENVGVLHDGFGAGRSDFSGPAGDEGGVETVVPIGPFTAGELRSLLAGEEDEGVVG